MSIRYMKPSSITNLAGYSGEGYIKLVTLCTNTYIPGPLSYGAKFKVEYMIKYYFYLFLLNNVFIFNIFKNKYEIT